MLDQDELVKLVEEKLQQHHSERRIIPHEPEGNCERVSAMRGNHIHAAAKALLLGVKMSKKVTKFVLAVLPGDRSVSFDMVAKECGGTRASMAPTDKVEGLMLCVVGRVPPFSFNAEVQVIVDKQLVNDNEKIYFSAGRLDQSFEMNAKAYEAIILHDKGKIFSFTTAMALQQKDGLFKATPAPTAVSNEAKLDEAKEAAASNDATASLSRLSL